MRTKPGLQATSFFERMKMKQRTFERQFEIKGTGLHSGLDSVLRFFPAPVDTGIVLKKDGVSIKALYSNVHDTRNCTSLFSDSVTISTIEHLMAALYIMGVDNVVIECSESELPILDGSAKVFFEKMKEVGLQEQNAPKKYLKVLKEVRFEDEQGCFVCLKPSENKGLHVRFDIDFPSPVVGHQVFDNHITEDVFSSQIAPARTFCEKSQIDYLKSVGLIKGGSLENAVVLDGNTILNPEGFRVQNECVCHKVLDLIGDLYTSGYMIIADAEASKTGHRHNNEVLKKLFESQDNYEIVCDE